MWKKIDEFLYLLDLISSVYDKVIANEVLCNVLQKAIATIYFSLSFSSYWSENDSIEEYRILFLKLKSKLGFYHVVLTTPKIFPKKIQ